MNTGPNPFQRIAFGSCFNPNRGDDIWDLILQYSPNQLVLLGDQIYADFHPKTGLWQNSNPDIIRKEYEKFFSLPGWKALVGSLTHGWISTYDDHDYGVNNGDKTWKYRDQAMQYFREFNKDHFQPIFYQDQEGNSVMDGVYSSKDFTVSTPTGTSLNYTIILLDSRSNKDPKGTPNGDFLGERQWLWLERELERASTTSNLIILGSSIQVIPVGKMLEELWNEFPASRQRLLTLVAKTSLRTNVIFLSGDIHSAELSQTNCQVTLQSKSRGSLDTKVIPRRLIEFTSSGLSHTFTHRMDIQKVYAVSKQKKAIRAGLKQESNRDSPPVKIPFTNHLPSLIYSRGYIAEVLFNVYQIAHPATHRQNRYNDLYPNLHFGTLDFWEHKDSDSLPSLNISKLDKSYDAINRLWKDDIADLEWQTVNYEGKTVMRKRIPLFDTFPPSHLISFNGSTFSLNDYDVAYVQCSNIQGEVPMWRSLLERMTLTSYIMIFFIIPVCWILWFVGASIFYLSWGKELKRRQILEDRYQQINKAKQH